MTKLTADFLKTAMPAPGQARVELRDDDEPGLALRVTSRGVRTWSGRYVNAAGEHRRKTLGRFPAVGLSKARDMLRKLKGNVADHIDVVGIEQTEKKAARDARLHTLDGLAEDYFADAAIGVHRVNGRPVRASTLYQQRRKYERLIKPTMGETALADITRRDVLDLVKLQGRKAASNGSYVASVLRQMLAYAQLHELIQLNPVQNIPVRPFKAGDRMLDDSEIKALWQAAEAEQFPAMGLAIRMIIVTMQRGGEVTGMRWEEIDRPARVWTIPAERMKNGRAHKVPLSDLALSLLDEASQLAQSEYVFPSSKRPGVPTTRHGMTQTVQRMVGALKMKRATPHDFRRTGVSNLTSERLGFTRFIAGQVLSHGGDTGGAAVVTGKHYDLNEYLAEKRRALDAWAALLEEIVSGKPRPSNVVPLAAAAR